MRPLSAWGRRGPKTYRVSHGVMVESVGALALIGLVVGAPTVLRAEHLVPPLSQILHLADHPSQWPLLGTRTMGGDDGEKVLITAAWAVWLWFVVCVTTEITTALRGRSRPRTAVSRRVQSLVAWLVGASLALIPTGRPTHSLRLPTTSMSAVSQRHGGRSTGGGSFRGGLHLDPFQYWNDTSITSGLAQSTTEAELTSVIRPEALDLTSGVSSVYTVQPGDTLWGIAERELGSPLEWKKVAELNQGRVQADGRTLATDNWVYPGWTLVLPTSATLQDARNLPPLMGSVLTTEVSTPDPSPGTPEVVPESESSPVRIPRLPPDAVSRNRADPMEPQGPRIPFAPVGYGLLGAGVVAVLDRMRRTQQRRRSEGLRIALPDTDLAARRSNPYQFGLRGNGLGRLRSSGVVFLVATSRECSPQSRRRQTKWFGGRVHPRQP